MRGKRLRQYLILNRQTGDTWQAFAINEWAAWQRVAKLAKCPVHELHTLKAKDA